MGQLAPVPDTAPVPPQNQQAEESVLGAMMLSPGAVDACRDVLRADGSEFYRESHARIWRAALRLTDAGEPVDAITLTDLLEETGELEDVGGRGRLYELAGLVPATANVAHYAGIVAENARLRGLIRLGGEIARLGWERPGEVGELEEQARRLISDLDHTHGAAAIDVETWQQFERSATEHVPTLVDQLWPQGCLGFIAAPPKKGKTWLGLSLAISVAAGTPFLGKFQVAEKQPVVLLAMEGHRAAIRGRIGALARGMGLNPDTNDLANLHIAYKPRGLNLADPAWVRTVTELVDRVGAQLLVVDVLRAAAVMKENSNDDFGAFIHQLAPISSTGCSIALLHHFGKLTEITKERSPGERMAGAGAMYGAFDVGVFITGSDDGARKLRVSFETRDLATPEPIGVHLDGRPTGINGGFVYHDSAQWELKEAPDEADLKAPALEIYEWICEQGGEVESSAVRLAFEISLPTLTDRERRLEQLGIEVIKRPGKAKLYRVADPPEDQQLLIGGISETSYPHPRSDPRSRTPEDFRGTPDIGGQTAWLSQNNGTPEHPESETALGVRNGDMQAFSTPEPPTSPTERSTTADASAPLQDADPSDDIDWAAP